ncbi:MAG: M1 family metallopeptidase, partial [Aquihabitans sp.]
MTLRRRIAVALLTCSALASCTVAGGGSDGSSAPAPERTTTSAPRTTTTTTAPGDPAPSADPLPDDVPDRTFAGLGDPRIDVSEESVTVRAAPDQDEISGRARLTLRSTIDEPLDSFTLDLRGPTVTKLTVDGQAASSTTADGELTITPASPIEPDTDVEVAISYEGLPDQTEFPGWGMPVGWQADDDGGWFTMSEPDGTATWVPVNDHPADKASWTVSVEVPKGVTAVGNGRLRGGKPVRTKDGHDRWTWVEEEPMASYLVLVAIGRYDLLTSNHGKVRVVRALPKGSNDDVRAAFAPIEEILDFYSSQFGTYPNDDAGAIVVPTELGLALESQTRPLFGTDGTAGDSAPALPHELAHQWFGDAVSPETWTDVWLNEGFATYADWMWDEHEGGRSVDDTARRTARLGPADDAAVRDPESAGSFSTAVYEGGALALHALRLTVGDEVFFRTIRRWVTTYDGESAATDDLVAIASDEAGKDLSGFFAEWLDQAPQPA